MKRTFRIVPPLVCLATAHWLVLPTMARADLPVTFLEVDAVPGAYFGSGYNMTTQQITAPCVSVDSKDTYTSGQPQQNTVYEFTENTATIASNSNLSASVSLKLLDGTAKYSEGTKYDVSGGTESSSYSQTLFASAYRYNAPEFLNLSQVALKPDIAQMIATYGEKGQFKQQCGDGFVIGIRKGREFFGTASIVKQDLKSWSKFANDTNFSAAGVWGSGKGELNVARQMERAFGNQNIKVKTYSTGSTQPNPTKVTELESYFKSFLNNHGEQSIVKLVVAPYNLVDGYPWEDPLVKTSKEDYIGMLVVALWELRAAIKDADFVLNPETANMFALGTNNQTKSSRINFVRQQRQMWQKEYDKLLEAAQQCDRSFSEKCQGLAEYYDRYRNLTEQRYAVLPARYLSDCYAPRTLKEFAKLANDLRSRNFGTPVAGDNETAGNPSRVVAELVLTPDQRQLKARLAVAKIEWKRDEWKGMPLEVRTNVGESGWGLQSQAVVFDLDNPAQFGLEQDNLRQCVFAPGLGLNTLKAPPAAAYFHRYGFNQNKIHGLIDGITGKHPRAQQHFGDGQGLLDYITCEVDRQGKDDNMQCTELGLHNLKLSLLNTLDIRADAWVRPPKPELPTALTAFFGEPTLIAAQHEKQFSQFKQLAVAYKQAIDDAHARKGETRKRLKGPVYQIPAVQQELINKRFKRTQDVGKPNPRMPASN